MKRWLFALALVLTATGAMGQTIVDLKYVQEAVKRCALLWDARSKDAFAKGHIPSTKTGPAISG